MHCPFQRPVGPHSLPSSQPSSANATNASSGGGSPFAPNSVSASYTAAAATAAAAAAGAFSRSAVRPRTPPHSQQQSSSSRAPPPPGGPASTSTSVAAVASSVDRSRLSEVQDLIHLEPAIYEDDVMRTLQARFFHQKYFVSSEGSFCIPPPFPFLAAVFAACRGQANMTLAFPSGSPFSWRHPFFHDFSEVG